MNTHQRTSRTPFSSPEQTPLMKANQLSPQKHTHTHMIFFYQENIHSWGDPEELLADVAT